MGIQSKIFAFLTGLFSQKITLALVAALPISELRLAIPLGIIKFKLAAAEVYFLSLLGNLLPVIPLLLFFKYFFKELQHLKIFGGFFRWWFMRAKNNSEIIERWGFWGLVIFVAIPLPATGAWTGTVAATLLGMKLPKAALAIAIGVALAGVIMAVLSLFYTDFIRNWLVFS